MKLHCPHCGVKGSADDSYSGRKVRCPKCHGVFEVTRDMSVEFSEDAAILSATAAAPVNSFTSLAEDVPPIIPKEGAGKKEIDADLPVAEAEEMLDFDDDLAESEPTIVPPAREFAEEEESLNWDDVASEIDLQLAEGGFAAGQEKIPDGSPVDTDSLQDAFDEPAPDEPVAPEIAAIAENYDKEIAFEEVQLIEETDEIEQKSTGAESAPSGSSAATADIKREPEASDPNATRGASQGSGSTFSLGGALKKAWTKLKGALSS